MDAGNLSDEELWEACRKLPSDWEPHGQRKWQGRPETQPDCADCCWFLKFSRTWTDWGVCANPQSPRAGLLTFREQACWQHEPQEGTRNDMPHPAQCGFMRRFEAFLRERAAAFAREEVRKANDPLPDVEPPAPRPEDIRESPLFIVLRRLRRHAEQDFRRQAVEEMAARARWDSSRYWESARRFWARTVGEDMSEIRLPANLAELEEEFWRGVDTIIREALQGRGDQADAEIG